MDDDALELSAQEKAYFPAEVIAEAIADDAGAPAAVETDATPEAKPDTEQKADKPEETGPQKTVPLAALHEERERRRELQAEIAATRERQALMEQRFQQLVAAQQPAEQPKTVDEDPIAAVKRQEQWIINQQIREEQGRQWQAQQAQIQQEYQHLRSVVDEREASFRRENADYDDGLKHLTDIRTKQYELQGYSPAEVAQLIHRDSINFTASALQRGRDPAADAYALAKQFGYAPKAAETPAVSGEQKMAMLEKGTAAAKSLSAGGGSNSELSLAAIAQMNDDDADEAIANLVKNPALFRKIAGPGSR